MKIEILSHIYKPIEFYHHYVKEAHARNIDAFFEQISKKANINKEANEKSIFELRSLEGKIKDIKNKRTFLIFYIITSILFILFAFYSLYSSHSSKIIIVIVIIFLSLGFIFYITRVMNSLDKLREELSHFQSEENKKRDLAWKQMAPLNKLFDWDITFNLIEKTLPMITFDRFLSKGRLSDLERNFGLVPYFGDNSSFLEAYSGVLFGNPFTIMSRLQHSMGRKTYYGSRTIHWTTQEKDGTGQLREVSHSQTLKASVTKDYPQYKVKNSLIYGHDAAPDLSFTREPSYLSSLGEGFFFSNAPKKGCEAIREKIA